MISRKVIAVIAVILVIIIATITFCTMRQMSKFPGVWAAENDEFCHRSGIDMALLTVLPDGWNRFAATLLVFDPDERDTSLRIQLCSDPLNLSGAMSVNIETESEGYDPCFESGQYDIHFEKGTMTVTDSDENIVLRLFRRYDLDPVE